METYPNKYQQLPLQTCLPYYVQVKVKILSIGDTLKPGDLYKDTSYDYQLWKPVEFTPELQMVIKCGNNPYLRYARPTS